jgi:heavy metal sensor kinase
MRSLRTRLIIGVIGGILLLLTVFGLIVYSVIRRALINQFDESLLSTARILAASVEQDGNQIELEFDVQQMPEFQKTDRPTYYQLWRPDGTIAAKSPLLGPNELLRLEGSLNAPMFGVLREKDRQPQRAVGFKFMPRLADSDEVSGEQKTKEQMLTLVVARDASGLYRQLDLLQWLLFITSAVTIALSVFIAAFVVRSGLQPLNSIAAQIASIKEDNLAARIGTERIPSELFPIKNRLNELLSRLEDSFNRERRFTADVAHELRTPLAGLRSILEVTLARNRDVDEYRNSLAECLEISKSMQSMSNNLLTLARIDAHQMTFRKGRIELAKLVDSCWRSFSDRALERDIVFDNRIPDKIVCESDPDCLSIVLSNLFDNAVEYANNAGKIWVTSHQSNDSVEISIANTGCQLTCEQASHIFDRFWRADISRANTGAHCGLGLALVERLVRALDGSTAVERQPGGIFIIRLVLPTVYLAGATQ